MSIVEGPTKRRAAKMTLFDTSRSDRGPARPHREAVQRAAPPPAVAKLKPAPKPAPAPAAPKAPPAEPAAVALLAAVDSVKVLLKMKPEAVAAALAQPGLAAEVAGSAGRLRATVKRAGVLAPIPTDEGRAFSHLNRALKEVGGLAKAPTDVLVDMICRLPPDVLERLGAAGAFMVQFANAGDAEPDVGELLAEAAARLEAMPAWKRTRLTSTLDPDALKRAAAVLTALAERRAQQDEQEDVVDVDAG